MDEITQIESRLSAAKDILDLKEDNMDWKERLKEEYSELTQRLAKLESFLNKGNVTYDDGTIDDESLKLLWKQRAVMRNYQDILFERICVAGIKL